MPPPLAQNLILKLKEFLIIIKNKNLILNQQDPATKQTIVALQRLALAVQRLRVIAIATLKRLTLQNVLFTLLTI